MVEYGHHNTYRQDVMVKAIFYPETNAPRHPPIPTDLWWEDEEGIIRHYEIDQVKNVRRELSKTLERDGWCYTCFIQGKTKTLYFDDTNLKWFIEVRSLLQSNN